VGQRTLQMQEPSSPSALKGGDEGLIVIASDAGGRKTLKLKKG